MSEPDRCVDDKAPSRDVDAENSIAEIDGDLPIAESVPAEIARYRQAEPFRQERRADGEENSNFVRTISDRRLASLYKGRQHVTHQMFRTSFRRDVSGVGAAQRVG